MREFVNEFEGLLNNITWDDRAITAAFQSKLPNHILNRIMTGYFSRMLDTYAEYKEAALQAESNIVLLNAQRNAERRNITNIEFSARKRLRTSYRETLNVNGEGRLDANS